MNAETAIAGHGRLIEPATLEIQRLLPGPAERIWAYLTESDLRRQWLASGDMQLAPDAPFELVWRNDELTDPPGDKPEGFGCEHRMTCRIIEADEPRFLSFTWGENSEVSFTLEPRGEKVLLTIIHSRAPDRTTLLMVSAGWHAHLDVLSARVAGTEATMFWDNWLRLKEDYDRRLPA